MRAESRAELDRALQDVDVVVDLTHARAARAQGTQVVLSVSLGATAATSSAVLLREVAAGRTTVTATIVAERADGGRTVVAAARTALTRRSLSESRRRVLSKVPALLVRGIDSLAAGEPGVTAVPAGERVGNAAVVAGAVRLTAHGARALLTSLTTTANYEVAWADRRPSDSPTRLSSPIHWVDHPRDHFLADPFLAHADGKTFVFVEDYSRPDGYATIGVFEPRSDASTFRTVLDRGTHVSYPFVFREPASGDWLMVPETAAERRVTLFRASSFPDEWHEDTVLLDGVSAYDPTILFRDGRYWLFYASGLPGSAPDDELHVAFADALRGPYTPHPRNPVKSDVLGSRPAGRLFDWNGRLIRPAQDSSHEYGYAIVFHEVTALTPTTFAEQPVDRLAPDWARGIRGTHSWDFLDDIVVTDAKRLRPRYAGARFTSSRAR